MCFACLLQELFWRLDWCRTWWSRLPRRWCGGGHGRVDWPRLCLGSPRQRAPLHVRDGGRWWWWCLLLLLAKVHQRNSVCNHQNYLSRGQVAKKLVQQHFVEFNSLACLNLCTQSNAKRRIITRSWRTPKARGRNHACWKRSGRTLHGESYLIFAIFSPCTDWWQNRPLIGFIHICLLNTQVCVHFPLFSCASLSHSELLSFRRPFQLSS